MAEEKRKPGRPPGSKNKTSSDDSKKSASSKSTKSATSKSGSKSSSKSKSQNSAAEVKPEKKIKIGSRVRDEIWAIIIIAIGAFLIIALQTNAAGSVGSILHKFFLGCFGVLGYVLPYYLLVYGVLLFLNKAAHVTPRSGFYIFTIFIMMTLINSGRFIDVEAFSFKPDYLIGLFDDGVILKNGGFVGMFLGALIEKAVGISGLYIFAVVVILVLLLLVLNTPVSQFIHNMKIKRLEKQKERAEIYAEAQKIAAEEAEQLEKEKEELAKAKLEVARIKSAELETPKADVVKPSEHAAEKAAKAAKLEKVDRDIADIKINIPGADGAEPVIDPTYIPGKMSEGQKNIMSLMKSEDLFEGRINNASGEVSYGLDGVTTARTGFGLDGGPVGGGSGTGLGLDGDIPTEEASDILDSASFDNIDTDGPTVTLFEDNIAAGTGFAVAKGMMPASNEDVMGMPAEGSNFGSDSVSGAASGSASTAPNTNGNSSSSSAANNASNTANTVPGHAAYDIEQRLTKKEAREAMLTQEEINMNTVPPEKPYEFPPITLLSKPQHTGNNQGNAATLRAKAVKLEETLKSFNVDARVINVTQGPSVTQYEVQPALGVKVSSIVKLSDDIALNLQAKNIRIEAPIPGKAAVGIEIENDTRSMVSLREVLESKTFKDSKSKISFAVGRDIYGNDVVGDIKEMPHMLVAGSTGSGKSVCINSIILSILYKAKPEEVKLVLVDPKSVELGNYNGIPHLLIPVVTKPEKAAAALNWAVAEMTDRYNKFAEISVRDLKSYNEAMEKNGNPAGVLPQIVIIIDELADLMMAAPSQVEESITRLAQMARAAGMHLIVATQRPSVDVVTGLIKANVPSRIAFKVASQIDSRTILDGAGAEKLAGKGDMLYAPQGEDRRRVQGVFVSNDEINAVIDFVKAQNGSAEYSNDVMTRIESAGAKADGGMEDEVDELLPEAIELVVQAGQASSSMLQRRFRIGYNRAARIIDMMEARGIIGPADGSRPRQVLMTETELYAIQSELNNTGDIEEEI